LFTKSPLCERIQVNLLPHDLDLKRSYIRDLAVLEVTRFLNKPDEKLFVEHLAHILLRFPVTPEARLRLEDMISNGTRERGAAGFKEFLSRPGWAIANIYKSFPIYSLGLKEWTLRLFAYCGCMALLLVPIGLMILFPGPWEIYIIMCTATLLTGILLTAVMDGVTKIDIMVTMAAYAAVLIVGLGQVLAEVTAARDKGD
jgi:hypothetical protein